MSSNQVLNAMKEIPQWLCFKFEDRPNGKTGKPPHSPRTGIKCRKNDESQFATYNEALVGAERYDLDGVGFVFMGGLVAIDLDDCFDEDGTLTAVAQDVYDHFADTYCEYSPSGTGLHFFMYGEKPNKRTRDDNIGIEVYDGYNFVTVTEDHVDGCGTDAKPMQDELDWMFDKYLPKVVTNVDTSRPADHGGKTTDEWLQTGLDNDAVFAELWNTDTRDKGVGDSDHDFALLGKLAYWLNRDMDAILTAFKQSPWYDSKDKYHKDKINSRKDYIQNSIEKVVKVTTKTASETNKEYEDRAKRFVSVQVGSFANEDEAQRKLDDFTDMGNAQLMADAYGDILKYTREWGWVFFTGTKWEKDADYRARLCAQNVVDAMKDSANRLVKDFQKRVDDGQVDPESGAGKSEYKMVDAYVKWCKASRHVARLKAMVDINQANLYTPVDMFDANPWHLNTPSGVVNLKTGEIMPHDPKYYCTSITAVTPDMESVKPMFDKFLKQIACDDQEIIDYLQQQCGNAAVGKVYTENLLIINGHGSNGKTTFLSTIQSVLGDYATTVDPMLLMSYHQSERQVGMARLRGARFAIAQETEEGQRLRPDMLKRLCSTDKVIAKRLYKDPEEFTPSHTLVVSTNHLPKISSTDKGTWRRIGVLLFKANIEAEDIITDFHNLLINQEGEQILGWICEGAKQFWQNDCNIQQPQSVIDASKDYRESEDWFSMFMGETCETTGKDTDIIAHADLYAKYNHWAKENAEYVRSSNAFSRLLDSLGFVGDKKFYDKQTQSTRRVWFGLKFINQKKVVMTTKGDEK